MPHLRLSDSLDCENKLAVNKNTLILLESSQYFEEEEYHYGKIDTLSRELKKCIVVKKVLTWLRVVKLSPQPSKKKIYFLKSIGF